MMQGRTSFTSNSADPRVGEGRFARVAAALGLLLFCATGLSLACGSEGNGGGETTPQLTPEEECVSVGGVFLNNVCEGKCTPDKCKAENTCIGNRCMLKCDSHKDCFPDGSQQCAVAKEDDTNADVFVCQPGLVPRGMGIECPKKTECDGVGVCPNGKGCERWQCGFQPDACLRDDAACGDNPDCNAGKCPDGSFCTTNPCLAAECKPFTCLSTGVGDADAYCTRQDCAADTDCAAGFYCGVTRDPHAICDSDPQKGDNNLCGSTSEECIDSATFGQGNSLFEGSMCILRKTCLKRAQCAPCASDLDCSNLPLHACKQIGGEGRCARACAEDKECDPDYECTEGSCVPRFGACKGTGNFCEPCQNDEDCGSVGTKKACIDASGGQKACFNYEQLAATCDPAKGCVECLADTDCPMSPSGRHGECFDEGEGYFPGDSVYHRCYLPYNEPDNKFECW